MLIGLDLLGVAMYQSAARDGFHLPAMGVFDKVFGDPMPAVQYAIQHSGLKLVRVQLYWSNNHQVSTSQFSAIAHQADRWEALAIANPGLRVQVSGMCEHKLGSSDAAHLKAAVMARAPHCEYVNSPMIPTFLPDTINEIHGYPVKKPAGRYQISLDGFTSLPNKHDAYFTDVETDNFVASHLDAEVIFGWVPRFNLRQKGTTADPLHRTAKPGPGYLETVAGLLVPISPQPQFSFPVHSWPKGWIHKLDAEDQIGGDGRANKPMLISTIKGDVGLRASNGQKLGIYKFYGPFTDPKYFRAYSGKSGHGVGIDLYGAEIAEKAKHASGSEWIALTDSKGNAYGPVHPNRRFPYRT